MCLNCFFPASTSPLSAWHDGACGIEIAALPPFQGIPSCAHETKATGEVSARENRPVPGESVNRSVNQPQPRVVSSSSSPSSLANLFDQLPIVRLVVPLDGRIPRTSPCFFLPSIVHPTRSTIAQPGMSQLWLKVDQKTGDKH